MDRTRRHNATMDTRLNTTNMLDHEPIYENIATVGR